MNKHFNGYLILFMLLIGAVGIVAEQKVYDNSNHFQNNITNVSNIDVNTIDIANPPTICSSGNAMIQFNGSTSECSPFLLTTGDTRMIGDYAFDTSLFIIDSINSRIGINTTTPDFSLEVVGNASINNVKMYKNDQSESVMEWV